MRFPEPQSKPQAGSRGHASRGTRIPLLLASLVPALLSLAAPGSAYGYPNLPVFSTGLAGILPVCTSLLLFFKTMATGSQFPWGFQRKAL